MSVNTKWNPQNIANDEDLEISNSLSVKERKIHSVQNSQHIESSFRRPHHLTFQADLSKEFHNDIIKTQSKKDETFQTLKNTKEGKYLKDGKNEEFLKTFTDPSLKQFLIKPSDSTNCKSNNYFSWKNYQRENKSNLQTPEKSMTFNADCSFSSSSNGFKKPITKCFPSAQHFDKNISTPEQQSTKQLLGSSEQLDFESSCKLDDGDFHLDF